MFGLFWLDQAVTWHSLTLLISLYLAVFDVMQRDLGKNYCIHVVISRVIPFSTSIASFDCSLETEGGQRIVNFVLFCLNGASTQILSHRRRQRGQEPLQLRLRFINSLSYGSRCRCKVYHVSKLLLLGYTKCRMDWRKGRLETIQNGLASLGSFSWVHAWFQRKLSPRPAEESYFVTFVRKCSWFVIYYLRWGTWGYG